LVSLICFISKCYCILDLFFHWLQIIYFLYFEILSMVSFIAYKDRQAFMVCDYFVDCVFLFVLYCNLWIVFISLYSTVLCGLCLSLFTLLYFVDCVCLFILYCTLWIVFISLYSTVFVDCVYLFVLYCTLWIVFISLYSTVLCGLCLSLCTLLYFVLYFVDFFILSCPERKWHFGKWMPPPILP